IELGAERVIEGRRVAPDEVERENLLGLLPGCGLALGACVQTRAQQHERDQRSRETITHRVDSADFIRTVGVQYSSPVSARSIATCRSCAAAYFNTNADAPARNAARATVSSPPAVTSTTFVCGSEALIVRQTSSPLTSGMARSATITSGLSVTAASSSARPSRTEPTTSHKG